MRKLSVCAVVGLLLLAGQLAAADKPDPTGSWKYTVTPPGGQAVDVTMTLKLEGDKLTGTTKRGENETKIEEGKFKDGEVSFQITRERDGNKLVIKYKGKLEGDAIKGKITGSFMGNDFDLDWNAKREKKSQADLRVAEFVRIRADLNSNEFSYPKDITPDDASRKRLTPYIHRRGGTRYEDSHLCLCCSRHAAAGRGRLGGAAGHQVGRADVLRAERHPVRRRRDGRGHLRL
jgi:hypothetical protein